MIPVVMISGNSTEGTSYINGRYSSLLLDSPLFQGIYPEPDEPTRSRILLGDVFDHNQDRNTLTSY